MVEVTLTSLILQQIINALTISCIYVLVALGLTMVYGVLRIIHIAHGAIYTIGAYSALLFFISYSESVSSLIVAALIPIIAGLFIFFVIYKPLLIHGPLPPLIASIGVYVFAGDFFRFLMGPSPKGFPFWIGSETISIAGSLSISHLQLFIFSFSFAFLFLLWRYLNKTRSGLALQAVAQNPEVASAVGINPDKVFALTFIIGSALAGIAGALIGMFYNSVSPLMGDLPILKGLSIIVLGGLGSIPGAVLGAITLGFTETIVIGLALPIPRDAIAFIVLITILVLRPTGISGKR
jgi:branched-chain amino acid transport system permease protein